MIHFELRQKVVLRGFDQATIQVILRAAAKSITYPQNFSLSVAIVPNQEMRQINKKYRKIDAATDVLSFRYDELSAEIVLSAERVKKQAKENGHPIATEAIHLFLHGLLHIFGWDHEKTLKDAKKMQQQEQQILKQCGYHLKF